MALACDVSGLPVSEHESPSDVFCYGSSKVGGIRDFTVSAPSLSKKHWVGDDLKSHPSLSHTLQLRQVMRLHLQVLALETATLVMHQHHVTPRSCGAISCHTMLGSVTSYPKHSSTPASFHVQYTKFPCSTYLPFKNTTHCLNVVKRLLSELSDA